MRQSFLNFSAKVIFSLFSGMALCSAGLEAQTPLQIPTSQAFGQVVVGATPATNALNFSFSGYANPTFTLAYNTDYNLLSSSCSGAGAVTCSATIAFRPTLPGLRKSAVLVKDLNGNLIAWKPDRDHFALWNRTGSASRSLS